MNTLFVARQPIFDRDRNVWGYELLYRSNAEGAPVADADQVESPLNIAASLMNSPDFDFREAYCLLEATESFIKDGHARALAQEKIVLQAPLATLTNDAIQKELLAVKDSGATLCLDLGANSQFPAPLPDGIGIVAVPFTSIDQVTTDWLHSLHRNGAQLLVTTIATQEEAKKACDYGADLLQGAFFQLPKTYSVKPFAVSTVNRLKILQLLESGERDVKKLAQAISADVSITLRLLKFVNSAAFSFIRTIDSVHQAIALVGMERLKNWLHLIIVSDMAPSNQTREIAHASAVRAKFLELLALYSGKTEIADKMYLLGLFSLLEAILEKRYEDIFKELQLDEDVINALMGHPSELLPWLELTQLKEKANWLQLDARAMELGIGLSTISKSEIEALDWANRFFTMAW